MAKQDDLLLAEHDDLLLRNLGNSDNIGIELQDRDDETEEPLWAVRSNVLLTTAELLALAQAIQEKYAAQVPPEAVAETLRRMRAHVAPRCYLCADCGGGIVTLWPGQRQTCPHCGAMYHEVDTGLRQLGEHGKIIKALD